LGIGSRRRERIATGDAESVERLMAVLPAIGLDPPVRRRGLGAQRG